MTITTLRRCFACGHENAEHWTLPREQREGGCAVQGCSCALFLEDPEILRATSEGLSEIQDLIDDGRVPQTLQTFEELHDYIDANELAGLTESRADWPSERKAIVQELMGRRIRAVAAEVAKKTALYRIDFVAFISLADGTERVARPGWLTLRAEPDEDVRRYADWGDDGLMDTDFLWPGDHFPSAANGDVIGGEGARCEEGETFFSAVITRITPSNAAPLVIDEV